MGDLSDILKKASGGGHLASAELLPLVYDELRNLARKRMATIEPGQTLQATALVHEAWLKLSGDEARSWSDRAHFFRAAAQAMRHILVDHARSRASRKRSGGQRVDLDEAMIVSNERNAGLVELDDALKRLSEMDERKGRVVEMKYFGGLSNEEMAEVLKVTTKTVTRDWQFARTWLLRELST